jgi:DNA phosphorothioation-dependent restriction protein DptG
MAFGPLGPLFNASSVLLDANPGVLPNLQSALLQMFQQLYFEQVTKAVVNFNVVETTTPLQFFGLWEPVSPYKTLMMNKDGQRKWSYFTLYALPTLQLGADDCISRAGVQYRVMSKTDYTQYGYNQYTLETDYTGSGPTGGE